MARDVPNSIAQGVRGNCGCHRMRWEWRVRLPKQDVTLTRVAGGHRRVGGTGQPALTCLFVIDLYVVRWKLNERV